MKAVLSQPWPWYVSGPLIGLLVPLLLFAGNKSFGISSVMKHCCSVFSKRKIDYFNYDVKKHLWILFFAAGTIAGGTVILYFTGQPDIILSETTKDDLSELGIKQYDGLFPAEIFSLELLFTARGLIFILLGGFMVGFGSRYAEGCTSGHAITGLSQFNLSSLLAVIGFFAGGLLITHFVLPFIL